MTVLAVGPHPDDVEIGCFGTLARLVRSEAVKILVLCSGDARGSPRIREQEAQSSADLLGASVEFLRYPDGSLSQTPHTIDRVRAILKDSGATSVFIPDPHDSHQDHVAASRILLASAARLNEVLLYETPSTVGFRPNLFYDVSETLQLKKKALRVFASQADRPYLDEQLVEGQARYWALRLQQKGRAFEAFALYRSVRGSEPGPSRSGSRVERTDPRTSSRSARSSLGSTKA